MKWNKSNRRILYLLALRSLSVAISRYLNKHRSLVYRCDTSQGWGDEDRTGAGATVTAAE